MPPGAREIYRACPRRFRSDPARADTWFILGSVLFMDAKPDAQGKFVISAECRQALEKYIELAPDGSDRIRLAQTRGSFSDRFSLWMPSPMRKVSSSSPPNAARRSRNISSLPPTVPIGSGSRRHVVHSRIGSLYGCQARCAR